MSEEKDVNQLLADHKAALRTYHEWDQKVKGLLKGRRSKDLAVDDMEQYRDAAGKRDSAYDRMRHLERALLEEIPGASTGPLKVVRRG